jgi:hypothetical protein
VQPNTAAFDRSILEQLRINRARTPDQRLDALCSLLDAARAMASQDSEARERRRRALAARQRDREQFRAYYRRLIAAHRTSDRTGVAGNK